MKKKEKLKLNSETSNFSSCDQETFDVFFIINRNLTNNDGGQARLNSHPTSMQCHKCTIINNKEFDDKDVDYKNDPDAAPSDSTGGKDTILILP